MGALDEKEVILLLRSEVEKAGGQAAWARGERVSRISLNRALHGHIQIPPSLIKALKLRMVYQHDTGMLTEERDIILLLRSEVEKAGSQFDWARREGINRTLLNKVINRRKPIPPSIRNALKLRTFYLRE
jgi:DNA-binding phage protein